MLYWWLWCTWCNGLFAIIQTKIKLSDWRLKRLIFNRFTSINITSFNPSLDLVRPPQICLHNSKYKKSTLPWPLRLPESTACLYLSLNFVVRMGLVIVPFSWWSSLMLTSSMLDDNVSCISINMSSYLNFTDSQSTFSVLFALCSHRWLWATAQLHHQSTGTLSQTS